MVTLRVHLDPVPATNAPLLIAPGSHKLGRIAFGHDTLYEAVSEGSGGKTATARSMSSKPPTPRAERKRCALSRANVTSHASGCSMRWDIWARNCQSGLTPPWLRPSRRRRRASAASSPRERSDMRDCVREAHPNVASLIRATLAHSCEPDCTAGLPSGRIRSPSGEAMRIAGPPRRGDAAQRDARH